MSNLPEPKSPLHDLAMPDTFAVGDEKAVGLTLEDRLPASLVQVQAWPDTVSNVEKAIIETAGTDATIMPSGPGRWLIETDEERLEEVLRGAIATDMGAVADLTHGRVVVTLSGEKAIWVLASGFALDFSLKAFPVGDTRLSHHHELSATILRTGENTFDLYVFTSYARGFWHWITNAAREVGYEVI
ncbi:MAG: sarcosine oxidase subunit gamma family protein [Pseudomonadota bacterium]